MKQGESDMDAAGPIWRGEANCQLIIPHTVVKIYVCSIKADFCWERRRLWEDTLPELQLYFLSHGVDVQLVDPQQGLDQDVAYDALALDSVFDDMDNCARRNTIPFVLILHGDKLGPCSLPTFIDAGEYLTIRNEACEAGKDVKLLDTWYKQDEGHSPPGFALQSVDTILHNYTYKSVGKCREHEDDQLAWLLVQSRLLELIQYSATVCHQHGKISNKNKYFVTGVEKLIQEGTKLCPENCLLVQRELSSDDRGRRTSRYTILKRNKNKGSDNPNQDRLIELIDSLPAKLNNQYMFKYSVKGVDGVLDPCVNLEHSEYLDTFHDDVVQCLKEGIEAKLEELGSVSSGKNHLLDEVICHVHRFKQYNSTEHVHIDDIFSDVIDCVNRRKKQFHTIVLLHGLEGCGKTTIISKICQQLPASIDKETVCIVRYAGLTHSSTTGHMILLSICSQIQHVLGQYCASPLDHDSLMSCYKDLLRQLEADRRHWIIAIDDLDYALSAVKSTEAQKNGHKWIGLELPLNVTFVATATDLHDNDKKPLFEKLIPSENRIHIPEITDRDIDWFVDPRNTKAQQRSLSAKKMNMLNIMKACPNPLFCTILTENTKCGPDVARCGAAAHGDSIESAISSRLAFLEERYGSSSITVLRYLLATPSGITEQELLDVLSCNNTVMVSVVNVITADQIRYPYVMWLRIKGELGCLLEERFLDQKQVVCLRNQALVQRLLTQKHHTTTQHLKAIHCDLAELYMETWASGRSIVLPEHNVHLMEELGRFTGQQPLLYGDTKYNRRKINQLWHHLLHAGQLGLLKERCFCRFEYLLAYLHARSLTCLLHTLAVITRHVLDADLQIIHDIVLDSKETLQHDYLQLGNELIGRLQLIKGQYSTTLEPLVQQAMDWCDSFHLPILVPLSSWLPDPRLPLVTKMAGPRDTSRLCVSPSGQHVYCSSGCDIFMYHVTSNKKITTFTGHAAKVTCLQAGHHNNLLFSAAVDGSVNIWQISTGRIKHIIKEHTDAVLALTLSKTDDTLITGSKDMSMQIIQVHTGDIKHTITQHMGAVTCVQLNESNTRFASGSMDKTIKMWDYDDLVLLITMDDIQSPVICLALSPDNTLLIFACEDETVNVAAQTTGTFLHTLTGHTGKINSVAISNDNIHCAMSGVGGDVYIHNICTTELLDTFTGDMAVSGMAVTDDDQFIFTATQECIQVWTFYKHITRAIPVTDSSHTKTITCYCVSAEGKMAVTGSKDCLVKLWNLDISDLIADLEGHTATITSVAIADQEAFAVSGSKDKSVKVWSIMMSIVITDYKEHSSPVTSIYIMRDNRRILTAGSDQKLYLWQAEDGVTLLTLRGSTHILDLSPNRQLGVSGDKGESSVRLWDVEDGKVLQSIAHTEDIVCVSFSADSQYVATGSADMSLKVWEASTGKLTQVLVEHDDLVSCAAITNDNCHVVSGSHDKCLLVWNLDTGTVVHRLLGHTDHVTCVEVTRDDSLAISGSSDYTLRVWNINRGLTVTMFDMHSPVISLGINVDASKVVVRLQRSKYLPHLCLHNSPAGDAKSQSDIQLYITGEYPLLPIRPRALILHRQVTTYALPRKKLQLDRLQSESTVPEIVRVSPLKAPLQTTLKAKAKKQCEGVTKKDKKQRKVENGEKKSGSSDYTLRVWNINRGLTVTMFDMHSPVISLGINVDASKVVVRLQRSKYLPHLCLHNSPAGDAKSQSDIQLYITGEYPLLPIRPRALILHRQVTTYALPRKKLQLDRLQSESTVPEIVRVSPLKAPLQTTLKAKAKKQCEGVTKKDKKQRKVENGEKKSGICSIL